MKNFTVALIFTILLGIIGCAGNSKATNILTGTIYVSGNEPFTHLALKSIDDRYYKIECSESLRNELWKLQGNIVELEVEELKEFEKLNIATVNGYSLKNDN